MQMQKTILFCSIILFIVTLNLFADVDEGTPYSPVTTNLENENQSVPRQKQFIPLPVIFYSPETSLGLGASFLFFNFPSDDITDPKPDVWKGIAFYTLNNQILTALDVDKYFKSGELMLNASGEASKFPDKFWGIGPDTPSGLEEDYTPIEFTVETSLLWELRRNLYLGPKYRFSYFETIETEEGGLLDQGIIPGSDGTIASGIGLQMKFDRRDNVFYPRKGYMIDLIALSYLELIGSEYNFLQIAFYYRHFFPLFKRHVLGIQYILEMNTGTVPFQMLPDLGGDSMMRGYYEGRYRDMNYTAFQGEYRFPLFWRFGGVVFGSVGKVAPDMNNLLSTENIRFAAGGGIRFRIAKEQHVNLRIDFAYAAEDFSAYFQLLEAF
jgi:hypothetical protein